MSVVSESKEAHAFAFGEVTTRFGQTVDLTGNVWTLSGAVQVYKLDWEPLQYLHILYFRISAMFIKSLLATHSYDSVTASFYALNKLDRSPTFALAASSGSPLRARLRRIPKAAFA